MIEGGEFGDRKEELGDLIMGEHDALSPESLFSSSRALKRPSKRSALKLTVPTAASRISIRDLKPWAAGTLSH
jgi:hypothetical protein